MTHCTQNKLSAIQFFLSCELCGGAVACLSLYLPLNKKSTRRHFDNILTNFALNRLWSEASVSFIISFLNKKWCLTLKFFDMWKIQLQVWSMAMGPRYLRPEPRRASSNFIPARQHTLEVQVRTLITPLYDDFFSGKIWWSMEFSIQNFYYLAAISYFSLLSAYLGSAWN